MTNSLTWSTQFQPLCPQPGRSRDSAPDGSSYHRSTAFASPRPSGFLPLPIRPDDHDRPCVPAATPSTAAAGRLKAQEVGHLARVARRHAAYLGNPEPRQREGGPLRQSDAAAEQDSLDWFPALGRKFTEPSRPHLPGNASLCCQVIRRPTGPAVAAATKRGNDGSAGSTSSITWACVCHDALLSSILGRSGGPWRASWAITFFDSGVLIQLVLMPLSVYVASSGSSAQPRASWRINEFVTDRMTRRLIVAAGHLAQGSAAVAAVTVAAEVFVTVAAGRRSLIRRSPWPFRHKGRCDLAARRLGCTGTRRLGIKASPGKPHGTKARFLSVV